MDSSEDDRSGSTSSSFSDDEPGHVKLEPTGNSPSRDVRHAARALEKATISLVNSEFDEWLSLFTYDEKIWEWQIWRVRHLMWRPEWGEDAALAEWRRVCNERRRFREQRIDEKKRELEMQTMQVMEFWLGGKRRRLDDSHCLGCARPVPGK